MVLFLVILCGAVAAFAVWRWSKRQARTALLASALTDHQRDIIARQVPLTRRLPMELRGKLEGKINLFLNQVEFIGCDGLEIDENMQLSIAAQACMLIANTDLWYVNLHTILVYPGAFKSRQTQHNGYVLTERDIARTGESWSRGPVVLSWAHTQEGASLDRDGHNVVFHEFAHQIDDLSGRTNGIPILQKNQDVMAWGQVFLAAFERHVHSTEAGHSTIIDPYGAEGIEEFFAVSVEVFFEQPQALKRSEPDLYDQLSQLFEVDPSQW